MYINLENSKATLLVSLDNLVSRIKGVPRDPLQYAADLRAIASHAQALLILEKWEDNQPAGEVVMPPGEISSTPPVDAPPRYMARKK